MSNVLIKYNDISDTTKVSEFLIVLGFKTYNLLKELITPDKPSGK